MAIGAGFVWAASAGTARAQSPFAGTWHGNLRASSVTVCNGSTQTCTYTQPYSGTVDSQGSFDGVWNPATETCIGLGGGSYPRASVRRTFQVPSSGNALVYTHTYSLNGVQGSCPLNAQFSSSPGLSMSGATSNCPTLTAPLQGGGGSCTNTPSLTIDGTGVAAAFPMTVTTSITASTATIAAAIQYRPQDVGTSGSVYTFAIAPATIAKAGFAGDPPLTVGYAKSADDLKDTPVACVLAQLNSAGQLQAVSASSLQSYVSGVLSAQGQAVSILNNASTGNVAGATFYVGYGTSATAMISGNTIGRAASVPGTVQCDPQRPQTGWWWNPAEGGRGYSIEVQGTRLFYAAYLYDTSGRSIWYVAAGNTSLDGSLFSGDLLKVTGGQTLTGAYRAPGPAQSVGAITLTFSNGTNGTMVWPGGQVPIERFAIVANGLAAPAQANVPEAGWWWNPAENGRGFFIEWQGGSADLAGYMYDDAGNPVWYIAIPATPNPRATNGTWLSFGGGQTLTGPYRPASPSSTNVGAATIQFDSATTATMTLPNGRQVPITRFRF